jgi:excisionase family DNA binding protein
METTQFDSTTSPVGLPLLTVPQAAKLLAISKSKLYELLARNDLKAVKIDACTRIEAAELERFVHIRRLGPSAFGEVGLRG